MFGWIIGTICLVALVSTLARGRFARRYGSYEPLGYGPPRGLRRRGMLRGLFAQLETTPSQENAIATALDDAFEHLRGMKPELHRARRELGALLASELLDRDALEALLAQRRVQLETAGNELSRLVTRVHEVLDDHQRRELGALIAEGSFGPVLHRGYAHARCRRRQYGYGYGY